MSFLLPSILVLVLRVPRRSSCCGGLESARDRQVAFIVAVGRVRRRAAAPRAVGEPAAGGFPPGGRPAGEGRFERAPPPTRKWWLKATAGGGGGGGRDGGGSQAATPRAFTYVRGAERERCPVGESISASVGRSVGRTHNYGERVGANCSSIHRPSLARLLALSYGADVAMLALPTMRCRSVGRPAGCLPTRDCIDDLMNVAAGVGS